MMNDDPKQADHLHADQDDVGGTDTPRYAEQQEGSEEGTGEGSPEHGKSQGEPFGHDEEGGEEETAVDVEGEN